MLLPALPLLLLPALPSGTPAGLKRRYLAGAMLGPVLATALFIPPWLRFRWPDQTLEFLGGHGRLTGMANALVAAWEVYLPRLFVPWPLQIEHLFSPVSSPADPRVAAAAAGLGVLLLVLAVWTRRNRLAAAGLALGVAGALPYLQFMPLPEAVAERFAYVPMLGFALLAAAAVRELAARFPAPAPGEIEVPSRHLARRLFLGGALGVLAAWGGLCFRRSLDWRTDLTLNLTDACSLQAASARPEACRRIGALALICAAESQPPEHGRFLFLAGRHLDALRRMQPQDAEGLRLRALLARGCARPDVAAVLLRQARALHPDDPRLRETARALGVP